MRNSNAIDKAERKFKIRITLQKCDSDDKLNFKRYMVTKNDRYIGAITERNGDFNDVPVKRGNNIFTSDEMLQKIANYLNCPENMKSDEILKEIRDNGGFANLRKLSREDLINWVSANFPCSQYVACNVAGCIK